jgi:hypothetical protein
MLKLKTQWASNVSKIERQIAFDKRKDELTKSRLIEERKKEIRLRLARKREKFLKDKERSKSMYTSRVNLHPKP